MSQALMPLQFPLHGSRLIEASAGTGKTWTIAALYVRLVLGHGNADESDLAVNSGQRQQNGFCRALLPSEILVMTFTRAATKELSDRIRARLVEAANCFRGETPPPRDTYLQELIAHYPQAQARQQAAYRLMLAAESMDDAAVFTIDAWCQRMLREHAFDSGSLFDEELVSDQSTLFEHAVRDYWRQQVYMLDNVTMPVFSACWQSVFELEKAVRDLIRNAHLLGAGLVAGESLHQLTERLCDKQLTLVTGIKQGWRERIVRLETWVNQQRAKEPACFHGNWFKPAKGAEWFAQLHEWVDTPEMVRPGLVEIAWNRLSVKGITAACTAKFTGVVPEEFDEIARLRVQLAEVEPIKPVMLCHAVTSIAGRLEWLKQRSHLVGFDDMLTRLKNALQGINGSALRQRIITQYPVALIDEFQDTSPDQYAIFNSLYQVAENHSSLGLLLIGDPKQSIYGFRGADIYSYLAARKATEGRHYVLGTNFRSTQPLVDAVNAVFAHAEGGRGADAHSGFPSGAFRFRNTEGNPLPFESVRANGRAETLVGADGAIKALTYWCASHAGMSKDTYHQFFAQHCAETIVNLLNDVSVGFASEAGFVRLQPADIAILVRDRNEAAAIRKALLRRKVASVYLSDKDSVIASEESADVLRWLRAIANPIDGTLGRAAYATRMAGIPLSRLAMMAVDDRAWEACAEQLKELHFIWQRQGVLAMLRRLIHDLGLPARLLHQTGGERALTNFLHLAEICQRASEHLDGEQALIRWLTGQIDHEDGDGEETVLRLESDAELVKVCTVHKSKGLEYPLVFVPFGVSARPVNLKNRSFLEYVNGDGIKHIDLSMSREALDAMESARIQEDLRLLYVALTRARHAVWLGVASIDNKIHESALGYLLNGGGTLMADGLHAAIQLTQNGSASAFTHIELLDANTPADLAAADINARMTLLSRADDRSALVDAPVYASQFEKDWAVGSFTGLTKSLVPTVVPIRILDNSDAGIEGAELDNFSMISELTGWNHRASAPWHQFPRGSRPGQFLHEQLEWMANEGFSIIEDATFSAHFYERCERSGWGNRKEAALMWLTRVVTTPLLPIRKSLKQLGTILPEMEFWLPSERLVAHKLDQFCHAHLLDAVARAGIPERELHGLLMGFADLVFEDAGQYWILDYKSNFIGPDDASYHRQALAAAMATHRYDIQGAIYMLALHRLLKNRLGAAYHVETHLGGAIFLFLRGVDHPQTHGCYHIVPTTALMDGLDQLFSDAVVSA